MCIALGQGLLQPHERRRVGPLQIVQHQTQGMVRPAEDLQKGVQRRVETVLGLQRPVGVAFGHRHGAEELSQLGDEIGEHRRVGPDRGA